MGFKGGIDRRGLWKSRESAEPKSSRHAGRPRAKRPHRRPMRPEEGSRNRTREKIPTQRAALPNCEPLPLQRDVPHRQPKAEFSHPASMRVGLAQWPKCQTGLQAGGRRADGTSVPAPQRVRHATPSPPSAEQRWRLQSPQHRASDVRSRHHSRAGCCRRWRVPVSGEPDGPAIV